MNAKSNEDELKDLGLDLKSIKSAFPISCKRLMDKGIEK